MDLQMTLKCRTCLNEYDEATMYGLYHQQEGEKLKLYEKVEFCCGVRIQYSVEKPTKICSKCFEAVQMWFNFRQVSVNSQVYLEAQCNDNGKAAEYKSNITAYLELLCKDLQAFRAEKSKKNEALDVDMIFASELIANELDEDEIIGFCEIENENELCESINSDDFLQEELINVPQVEKIDSKPNKATTTNMDYKQSIDIVSKNKATRGRQKQTTDDFLQEELINVPQVEKIDSKPNKATTSNIDYKLSIDIVSENKATRGRQKQTTHKKGKRRKSLLTPATYMCALCANIYSNKASFNYHMNVHANFKPHECELCGKTFQQSCQFKAHMRRHTGEKPYRCSFCDRRFYEHTDKRRHERTHTNEKPFQCHTCGKAFSLTATLRAHKKLHDKEKEFRCIPCNKSFTLRHQFTSHCVTKQHMKVTTTATLETDSDSMCTI